MQLLCIIASWIILRQYLIDYKCIYHLYLYSNVNTTASIARIEPIVTPAVIPTSELPMNKSFIVLR